jgi:hypothetical protein
LITTLALLAQNLTHTQIPTTSSAAESTHSNHPSSPPPAAEDELDVFISNFDTFCSLDADTLVSATEALREVRYTLYILLEPAITVEHLQSLTKLTEGDVIALRKFAQEWLNRIDGNWARRGIKCY